MNYLKRIADDILLNKLEASGAVLIEGPKWCGKTTTAKMIANSCLFMQDPDKSMMYLKAIATKPSVLLRGKTPRLLDEWQTAPVLWDAVRHAVDIRGGTGHFILTGSAVPNQRDIWHSGTGRISRMVMEPLSLFESLESTGAVSLLNLFDQQPDIESIATLTLEDIAFCIVRGGWPAAVKQSRNAALQHAQNYVDAVVNTDLSRVDGDSKNPYRVAMLLNSLARNISTLASLKTIRDDIALGYDDTLSEKTISLYLNAMSRIFVSRDTSAWNPALRSKTAIRTSAKRQFIDPSLATAILRLTPEKLFNDFNYFGFLFESLCIRDLRIYANAIDGDIFHYRDKSGLEADAVIVLRDGRWAAIEIKMGAGEIELAAKHLLMLKDKIDSTKMHNPSFLMVITATEYAYRREDGVYIVPLGCLKP